MAEIRKLSLFRTSLRYILAIVAVALALLSREAMERLGAELPPYITFFPAVVLVAVLGGLGPGILATTAATLAADYWIIPPKGFFTYTKASDILGLGLFFGIGIGLSVVADGYRRSQKRAAVLDKELALRESYAAERRTELRYRTLFTSMTEGFALCKVITDAEGQPHDFLCLEINPAFQVLTGLTDTDIVGKTARAIFPNIESGFIEELAQVALTREPQRIERYFSGRYFDMVVFSPQEGLFAALFTDITDRRRAEEALRNSQKMEAIGKLAGGIAHDFNNLMTVVMGYSDLLRKALRDNSDLSLKADEIHKAGEHATSLTRQLLAFSRQQAFQLGMVNLNNVLLDMRDLLRGLLREDIELKFSLDPSLGPIFSDKSQIEQVVMNLVVNARDAIADRGTVEVSTANLTVTEEFSREHGGTGEESYVVLAVIDSGVGMDAAIMAHIFEPFFTTKEGRGTGLGLATVYGIVKQAQGFIVVESEPRRGTVIKVFLPRVEGSVDSELQPKFAEPQHGSETILVVEDQAGLLAMVREILQKNGYRVLVADNGRTALRVLEACAEPVALVLTDLVMPEMGGRELATLLHASHPQIKILFMSGYLNDVEQFPSRNWTFMEKPFSPGALLRKLRQVLDEDAGTQHPS